MTSRTDGARLFREFDHTGDLGIELEAPSRDELFRRAGLALAAILVEPGNVAPRERRVVEVPVGSNIDTMHDMLTALLTLFSFADFIWGDASVTERAGSLGVTGYGERFDPSRHEFRGEIKAVTYHQLVVEESGGGWRARVIFDV